MDNEKFLIYLAGSLFTDKERAARDLEYNTLMKELGEEVEVYSPMHNDEINDKSKVITPQDIFNQDTEKVLESDFITASLEEIETDSGVATEVGIAMGVNIILSIVTNLEKTLLNEGINDVSTLVDSLFSIVPPKKICANYSDIRLTHNNELKGIYKDCGLNQYVIGGLLADKRHSISQGFTGSVDSIKKEIEIFEEFSNKMKEEEEQ